jgi:NAD(P)-dependent dehydrogenase (short-subunit alcohol dehydrogenase family)
MAHHLVIGATGMLAETARTFAREGHTVSAVARTKKNLIELVKQTQVDDGVINPVALDYTETDALSQKLTEAITILGPIDTAVCWIHKDAPQALPAVGAILQAQAAPCRLFHILSHNKGVGKADSLVTEAKNISYRTITLGYKVEGAARRWLTDDEISWGILEAIYENRIEAVIGQID